MLTVEVWLVIEVRISAVDSHNVAAGPSSVLIRLTVAETMWLRQWKGRQCNCMVGQSGIRRSGEAVWGWGVDHPDQYRVVHRHTARSLLSPTRLIHNPQPTRPFLLLQPAQETLDSIADKDFQNLLYFSQDSYASRKMEVHDGLSWKIGLSS